MGKRSKDLSTDNTNFLLTKSTKRFLKSWSLFTSQNEISWQIHTCVQLVWLDRLGRLHNFCRQDEFSNAGMQLRLIKEAPTSFSNHNASRLLGKSINHMMRCFNGTPPETEVSIVTHIDQLTQALKPQWTGNCWFSHHFCFVIEHVRPDMYTVCPRLSLPSDLRKDILNQKVHYLLS